MPLGRTPEPPCFILTDPRGLFVYFYQIQKISKIFCENPLTILAFCDKIVNCIIIAFTMGISALRQGIRSKKGDFTRLSLCNSTKPRSERSIRLRPRHLPCPWVVRLTHEAPDVPALCIRRMYDDGFSPQIPRRRSGIRPTVPHQRIEME